MAQNNTIFKDGEVLYAAELNSLKSGFVSEAITLKPKFDRGAISATGDLEQKDNGKKYLRTTKFLKPVFNDITLSASTSAEIKVFQYDANCNYIAASDWLGTDENQTLILQDNCIYIKVCARKNSELEDLDFFTLSITNMYDASFFNKPNSSGKVINIALPFIKADPTATDGETWAVQDAGEMGFDYGVLHLPPTYTQFGEPTRLVIYCHGAGGGYTSTSTGVGGEIVDYLLKEGYAIMDMDGDNSTSSEVHGYSPQARQSYERGYQWVVDNFNIYTDGTLVCGRSMGGGMCFEILQSHIPVLAACPIVPVCNYLWWWNYMNASRRTSVAKRIGLTGEDAPTWSGTSPMPAAEWNYLKDNFDKVVKYSPFWRAIDNLPSKDILFADEMNVSKSAKTNEYEANVFNNLSMSVKAPVKIFDCYEDTTVPPSRNAIYVYNMLRNNGQEVELRMFNTTSGSAHQFESTDPNRMASVTTKYGETVQASIVYIEMVRFWRRYEPSQR